MVLNNVFVSALVLTLFSIGAPASKAQEQPAAAAPSVQVEYVDPEKFSDITDSYFGSGETVRVAHLEALRKHIQMRAGNLLTGGQNLTVTITEIDRAGHFEPWRPFANDARIIRDSYPPRINLYFKLTSSDGALIKNGQRKLRDPAFLTTTTMYHNDPLRHEKALLDDWLKRDFGGE